jgi:hypothetical protein
MKKKPMVKMHGQSISFIDKLKPVAIAIYIFGLIIIAHSLAFEDEVAQHKINCASATYVLDNNLNCGE